MADPLSSNEYDPRSMPMRSVEDSAPVESYDTGLLEAPVVGGEVTNTPVIDTPTDNPTAARTDAQVPAASAGQNTPIQLYEERLVTQTQRVKTGEVKISKRVVTDSASADIPVTKEKIIIEIESIYTGETRIDIGDARTAEDGSVHMDIYEEQALSCRRIVPYQSVSVRKEIVSDMVTAQEVLRREELDIVTESVQADGSVVNNTVLSSPETDGSRMVEERFRTNLD